MIDDGRVNKIASSPKQKTVAETEIFKNKSVF